MPLTNSKHKCKWLPTCLIPWLLLGCMRLPGAELFVDSLTVSSGSCGIVTVRYNSSGDRVSSLQFDLVFDNSILNLSASAGLAVHTSFKSLYSASPNSGSLRVLLTSTNRNVLNDGQVLTLYVN